MTPDGNDAQIRMIVGEAVKQAAALAQEQREGGLRAQATMVEKVVGAALIALVLWVGVTVQNTDKRVAVIESQIKNVAEGRYTSGDASRDQQIMREQLEALRARVTALEGYHREGGSR